MEEEKVKEIYQRHFVLKTLPYNKVFDQIFKIEPEKRIKMIDKTSSGRVIIMLGAFSDDLLITHKALEKALFYSKIILFNDNIFSGLYNTIINTYVDTQFFARELSQLKRIIDSRQPLPLLP